MKAIHQLLSCLLVTSVAMLNSGAAWSGVSTKASQAQSPTKAKVKRARQARAHTKNLAKPKAVEVTVAPTQGGTLATAEGRAAPSQVVENPYLKGAASTRSSGVNAYLPTPSAPTIQPTPAKAGAETPAFTVVPVAPAKVEIAASVPVKIVVTPAATSASTVEGSPAQARLDTASEQAWAKIVAGPAAAPAAPASTGYVPRAVANPYLGNPYLTYRTGYTQAASTQVAAPQAAAPASPAVDPSQVLNSLRNILPEPHLPSPDIDILPSITKVYPTGERPMYVLTFKCPTELVGITPPPTKALRWLITGGMDAVNSTNLLPFSMQQVCQ